MEPKEQVQRGSHSASHPIKVPPCLNSSRLPELVQTGQRSNFTNHHVVSGLCAGLFSRTIRHLSIFSASFSFRVVVSIVLSSSFILKRHNPARFNLERGALHQQLPFLGTIPSNFVIRLDLPHRFYVNVFLAQHKNSAIIKRMVFRIVIHVVLATSVVAQSSHYLFGPSFGIRKYPGNSAIITSFETTLIPGAPSSPAQRRLAIWPGLDTSNGDLIQPIIVSSNEAQYTR